MTIEQQRAEFETWFKNYDNDGEPYISAMFASWQAAIASVSAQPELTEQEIVTVIGIQGMFADEVDICRAVLAAQRAKDKISIPS